MILSFCCPRDRVVQPVRSRVAMKSARERRRSPRTFVASPVP